MTKQQSNYQQLSLCIDKPISTLIKDLKVSRHPLVMDATNKLEEALRRLQYIQDAGVVKSTKTKTAIYELLTKV
jgi:hypothetical protein